MHKTEIKEFDYDFYAGDQHWEVNILHNYVRITSELDKRNIKESYDLGQLSQLEDFRIAAYEGTYAMIAVSPPVDTKKSNKLPPMRHDRHGVNIIWGLHLEGNSNDEAG
tara:strand:+ start:1161 stop:1487 length:327 start_codon:yes stop_codon:yes gene_type:complete